MIRDICDFLLCLCILKGYDFFIFIFICESNLAIDSISLDSIYFVNSLFSGIFSNACTVSKYFLFAIQMKKKGPHPLPVKRKISLGMRKKSNTSTFSIHFIYISLGNTCNFEWDSFFSIYFAILRMELYRNYFKCIAHEHIFVHIWEWFLIENSMISNEIMFGYNVEKKALVQSCHIWVSLFVQYVFSTQFTMVMWFADETTHEAWMLIASNWKDENALIACRLAFFRCIFKYHMTQILGFISFVFPSLLLYQHRMWIIYYAIWKGI